MKRNGWIVAAALAALLLMGASYDMRAEKEPVARVECTRVDWITDEGHTAQTTTANLNGVVYRIDIIISEVTGNPTVDVSFANQNSVVCLPAMSALADGTKHFKNALVNSISTSADFNPVAVADTITVTVDPSADPNGVAQTLSVDVIFYVR